MSNNYRASLQVYLCVGCTVILSVTYIQLSKVDIEFAVGIQGRKWQWLDGLRRFP